LGNDSGDVITINGTTTFGSGATVSSPLALSAGTASAPALTTTGDTNTGIFFPAADTIAFAEGGVESARLDASGNLGVGTSSPGARLDIQPAVYAFGTSQAEALRIRSNASGGTTTSPTSAGALVWGNGTTTHAVINSVIDNPSASSRSSLAFSTNVAGTLTEAARIDSSGNLLVGVTVPYYGERFGVSSTGTNIASYRADTTSLATHMVMVNPNGAVGSITSNGSSTSFNTSSDYRLKNSISPMTGALAKVAALKPCTYKWNADGSDGQGFIAHELAEVVPQCVNGEKDAVETYTDEDGVEQTRPRYQGIDTSFLVATLTAAIQEQQALIQTLTARVTALEGK
jgi:hypothetical protein